VKAAISVLVLTFNEERNLGACLDSIVGWADQIVVVDSGSTDRTLALCAECGVETHHHEYIDHRSQLQWALSNVDWKHDWLLVLDADRCVTPEFRNEVDEMLRNDAGRVHGYYNPHIQYFRSGRVRGLKTRYLQLVRRDRARVSQSELVDGRLVVDGPTGIIAAPIIERNEKEGDIDFWIDKHQRYARRIAVEEVLRAQKIIGWSDGLEPRLFGHTDERTAWLRERWYSMPLYVRPVLLFVYRYVLRLGFLDGWNGFAYHALQSFWFRLLIDVHISEYRQKLKDRAMSVDELIEIATPHA
jgi:glycosyltransferase involved in cell wall biosynthesis